MDFIADLEYIDRVTRTEPWAQKLWRDAEDAAEYWLEHFEDSPERTAGWGHHNYCSDCHSRLVFDIERPYDHICSNCGKNNQEQKHHDVWVAQYRSRLASDLIRMAMLHQLAGRRGNGRGDAGAGGRSSPGDYLAFIVDTIGYYADHYSEFEVHGDWVAKGKIMWQALEESTFAIALLKALAIVRDSVRTEDMTRFHRNLFRPLAEFVMAEPEHLPNIRLWIHSAAGMAALLFDDKPLLEAALGGDGAVRQLLTENVTAEGFWREGSFHYHFYALHGITDLLHLAHLTEADLGVTEEVVRRMYRTPIRLSYDDLSFPNPNDGWPDASLSRYVHQYELADTLFRDDDLAGVVSAVYRRDPERRNINTLLYGPVRDVKSGIPRGSVNLPDTNFAILRNEVTDVFMKYGFASRSHPHFDRMTIEIYGFSRDPSNIGYGSPLHGEWYRNTPAHNTVCVDGENQPSLTAGRCIVFEPCEGEFPGGAPHGAAGATKSEAHERTGIVEAEAQEVYPGVVFRRRLELEGAIVRDRFVAESTDEHVYDWFFHAAGELAIGAATNRSPTHDSPTDRGATGGPPAGLRSEPRAIAEVGAPSEPAAGHRILGFSENGYQHLSNVSQVAADSVFTWTNADGSLDLRIEAPVGARLFRFDGIGNPATERWPGVLVRVVGTTMLIDATYEIRSGEKHRRPS